MTILINQLIIVSLNVGKSLMKKCPAVQGDVFRIFVLSDQQSKSQRYSMYNNKTENPHIWEDRSINI